MLIIESNSSDRKFILSNLNGDCYQAELKGSGLSAVIEVYAYTDTFGLNQFFQELASCDKPWPGEREWQSLEGEFTISATSSVLGDVVFQIELRMTIGTPEESLISAGINTEWGQLLKIAKEAKKFFQIE